MATGIAALSLRVGGLITSIIASMTPEQKAAITTATIEAGKKGAERYQKNKDGNMREEKRQRLFGKEGKVRDAFTPAARARRQEKRKDRRQSIWAALTRPQAGPISGNATAAAANVIVPSNLGANMPGPGTPQNRRSVRNAAAQQPSYDTVAWYTNPVFWVLGGGAYLYLTRKK